jgi:carboxyl-terminal processing protease
MISPDNTGRRNGVGFALVLALGLGMVGGVAVDRLAAGGLAALDVSESFRLIGQAWNTIERVYVDRAAVQPRAMTYGAISGMVDALGDTGHSRFLSPSMVKALGEFQRSTFEGIGAEIQIRNGHVVIVAPLDHSPAQRAGLRPGDIILDVNGRTVTGLAIDRVIAEISGPAGTSVTLTILDSGSGRTRTLTLVRASITIHEVNWRRLPGRSVAHVRISSFGKGVTSDLRQALTEVRREGIEAVVLDLRNNPGGLLEEAIGATSQFLAGGNVLLTKDSHGTITPVPVKAGGIATTIPLVVLINGGTASAAEITAGAIEDAHRAKLVGQTTFGTGTVLSQFPLADGSALLLAIEEWLTPAGHVIWHKGIVPQVAVSLPDDAIPLLPEEEAGMTAEQLRASRDTQLLRAIELLKQ